MTDPRPTIEDRRYRPANSDRIEDAPTGAVAFIYASQRGLPAAICYRPKAWKPTYRYAFKTEAEREKFVAKFFADEAAEHARKAASKAEEKAKLAAGHTLKLGDVLVSSWGYDQTNVDFYQVVRLVGRNTVALRPIRGTQADGDDWAGYVVPAIGAFRGDEFPKRVDAYGYVKIASYCSARLWDGKPCYRSSYA